MDQQNREGDAEKQPEHPDEDAHRAALHDREWPEPARRERPCCREQPEHDLDDDRDNELAERQILTKPTTGTAARGARGGILFLVLLRLSLALSLPLFLPFVLLSSSSSSRVGRFFFFADFAGRSSSSSRAAGASKLKAPPAGSGAGVGAGCVAGARSL